MELRCRDCANVFDVPARLADFASCDACGSEELVDNSTWDEEEVPEPQPGRRTSSVQLDPARAAAHELLLQNRVESAPIDVEAIAANLGLAVIRQDLGKVSGELRGKRIKVNSRHHLVRQRFSIAHEIGHHVLHTEHDSAASSLTERQANAFAAALLMPPGLLRREVERTSDFDELRRQFKVSRDALGLALERSGLLGRIERDT